MRDFFVEFPLDNMKNMIYYIGIVIHCRYLVDEMNTLKEMLTRDASLCCVCDVFSRQYCFYPIRSDLSHRPEVFPTSLEKKHLMPVAFPLFDPALIAQGFYIEAARDAIPCEILDL